MEMATLLSICVVAYFIIKLWLEAAADVKFKAERNHRAYLKALRDQGIEVRWYSDKFMTHDDFIKIIKGL